MDKPTPTPRQALWNHLHTEHNLTLSESELDEIIIKAQGVQQVAPPASVWATPDGLREALIAALDNHCPSVFSKYAAVQSVLTAIAPYLPAPTVAVSDAAALAAKQIQAGIQDEYKTGYIFSTEKILAILARHFPFAPAKEDSEMLDWLEKLQVSVPTNFRSGKPPRYIKLSREFIREAMNQESK